MATAAAPLTLPKTVLGRLAGLRRRVRAWLAIDGLYRLLAWVVALAAIDAAVDWLFRMDWSQRLVSLCLIGCVLAAVAYRRLLRPLTAPIADDVLCLQVEARHRQLGQSLISALEFSRGYDPLALGVSSDMVQATIDEGARAARGVDFSSVLDRRTLRRNLLGLALLGLVLGLAGAAVAQSELGWIWFNRNVLLGNLEWPQSTHLTLLGVRDGVLSLPRGDDWEQIVTVTGVRPDRMELDYQPSGWRSRITEPMIKTGESQFRTTFKNVLAPFQFRVRGGDAYSRWVQVELIERPEVAQLELQLTPPAYAGGEVEMLPAGKSPYYVLKGSRLAVSGLSSKDLSDARLLVGERSGGSVSVRGRTFGAQISPADLTDQTYSVELTDTDGWQSKRPARFSLRIRPDRPPAIRARLEGISGMIVPGATLPLVGSLEDDFRVQAARLVYQLGADSPAAPSPGPPSPGASESPSQTDRRDLSELAPLYGRGKVPFRVQLETGPLTLAAESLLRFHLEADDNDTVSGPKTGKSSEFLVRVVVEEELRADLLRREKEQRLEVQRLLKDQEDLLTDCQAILAAVGGKPALPDDQRQLLVQVARRQTLAADRAKAVAAAIGQLVAEIRNNHLEEAQGPLERRLTRQVMRPLEALAADAIPGAAQRLDSARQSAGAEERDEDLAAAAALQQRVVQSLRAILKAMAKSEGFQEAVNMLYAILKSQSDVHQSTVKESQRRIRELFENKKPAAPK